MQTGMETERCFSRKCFHVVYNSNKSLIKTVESKLIEPLAFSLVVYEQTKNLLFHVERLNFLKTQNIILVNVHFNNEMLIGISKSLSRLSRTGKKTAVLHC